MRITAVVASSCIQECNFFAFMMMLMTKFGTKFQLSVSPNPAFVFHSLSVFGFARVG